MAGDSSFYHLFSLSVPIYFSNGGEFDKILLSLFHVAIEFKQLVVDLIAYTAVLVHLELVGALGHFASVAGRVAVFVMIPRVFVMAGGRGTRLGKND